MKKYFRVYRVKEKFPSISISGNICALNCRHCNHVYLNHFYSVKHPDELLRVSRKLKRESGVSGILITGGCDRYGRLLNLRKFLSAIAEIHKSGLIIKLHTGFVSEKLADEIAAAGVDIASHEVVGSSETIKEIFRIDKKPEDYIETFRYLADAGVPYLAPHIAIGLHYGKLKGESNALKLIKKNFKPSTVSLIVFRPTAGTELENMAPPANEDIAYIIKEAKRLFHKTKIVLGMMRPRGMRHDTTDEKTRNNIEKIAFLSGIDGIEEPSVDTLSYIKKKIAESNIKVELLEIKACGVLPYEYERFVEVSRL